MPKHCEGQTHVVPWLTTSNPHTVSKKLTQFRQSEEDWLEELPINKDACVCVYTSLVSI